jgi:hypothetical protein
LRMPTPLPAANEQMPVSGNYTVVLAEAAGQDRFRRRSSGYDEVFSAAVSELVGQVRSASGRQRPSGRAVAVGCSGTG